MFLLFIRVSDVRAHLNLLSDGRNQVLFSTEGVSSWLCSIAWDSVCEHPCPSTIQETNSYRQTGLVNFVFCIPAMRTIDTRGRRTWLLATLPIMCLMLAGAAGSYPADDLRSGDEKIDPMSLPQTKAAIVFIFCEIWPEMCVFRCANFLKCSLPRIHPV